MIRRVSTTAASQQSVKHFDWSFQQRQPRTAPAHLPPAPTRRRDVADAPGAWTASSGWTPGRWAIESGVRARQHAVARDVRAQHVASAAARRSAASWLERGPPLSSVQPRHRQSPAAVLVARASSATMMRSAPKRCSQSQHGCGFAHRQRSDHDAVAPAPSIASTSARAHAAAGLHPQPVWPRSRAAAAAACSRRQRGVRSTSAASCAPVAA